jgi:hypothetical protein
LRLLFFNSPIKLIFNMKNLLVLIAFSISIGLANAQTTPASTPKTTPAEHAKTMPAKTMGNKTVEPTKTNTAPKATETTQNPESKKMADMNTKEHVCAASCKDGKHVYAHGEKGHTCGADCKKMMSKTHKAKKMAAPPEVKKS